MQFANLLGYLMKDPMNYQFIKYFNETILNPLILLENKVKPFTCICCFCLETFGGKSRPVPFVLFMLHYVENFTILEKKLKDRLLADQKIVPLFMFSLRKKSLCINFNQLKLLKTSEIRDRVSVF